MKGRLQVSNFSDYKTMRAPDKHSGTKSSTNSPLLNKSKNTSQQLKITINPVKTNEFKRKNNTRHKTQLSANEMHSPKPLQLSPRPPESEFTDVQLDKLATKETIISAFESLHDLRYEARSCLDASKKMIQNASKFRRMSAVGFEELKNTSLNSSEMQSDIVKDLTMSIIDLKNRIQASENNSLMQLNDDTSIQDSVQTLKKRIEERNLTTLDSSSVSIGCTNSCMII